MNISPGLIKSLTNRVLVTLIGGRDMNSNSMYVSGGRIESHTDEYNSNIMSVIFEGIGIVLLFMLSSYSRTIPSKHNSQYRELLRR